MVTKLPTGVFTMKVKRTIIKNNTNSYKKSSKKIKSLILDELVQMTGFTRAYIARLIRSHDKCIKVDNIVVRCDIGKTSTDQRGRKKKYPDYINDYLYEIWKESGSLSAKHLVRFIEENIEHIVCWKSFSNITVKDIWLLLEISHSTIERRLKDKKEKHGINQRYRTNRGVSHIKSQIPVERHYEKKVEEAGYMEIDLVHHSGHNASGEFLYTLTSVDVLTDWACLRILKNKARVWTCDAIDDTRNNLPFALKHIHSDNGSEFINDHLLDYTRQKGKELGFSRSRPYQKNDNPHVECKNWTIVRQYTGYRRYDTSKEMKVIEKLYKLIELKHNLFVPSMKIIEKKRIGAKVFKKHSTQTPLSRLLQSSHIEQSVKHDLLELKHSIDLYELNRKIKYYQNQLDNAYSRKRSLS